MPRMWLPSDLMILPEEVSSLPCPECHHHSCRLCKKSPHEPQTCKQAAEKKKTSARARAEDAMTRAVVRNCPGCGKGFVKEKGCNKMSCYLCRQEIADYTHFFVRHSTADTTLVGHASCSPIRSKTIGELDGKQDSRSWRILVPRQATSVC
jgi:hypothetical protein